MVIFDLKEGGISEKGAYYFKKAVYGPLVLVHIGSYSMMSVGAALLICVIILVSCRTIKKVSCILSSFCVLSIVGVCVWLYCVSLGVCVGYLYGHIV